MKQLPDYLSMHQQIKLHSTELHSTLSSLDSSPEFLAFIQNSQLFSSANSDSLYLKSLSLLLSEKALLLLEHLAKDLGEEKYRQLKIFIAHSYLTEDYFYQRLFDKNKGLKKSPLKEVVAWYRKSPENPDFPYMSPQLSEKKYTAYVVLWLLFAGAGIATWAVALYKNRKKTK